jgi:hypothetical protein
MIHVKCGVGKKSPDRPVSVLSQVYSLAHSSVQSVNILPPPSLVLTIDPLPRRSTTNIIPSRRQLRPVHPIQPDWEELFAHDTSSAPLLHQDYQYLYCERTFRPIGINHLFQLEMGLYRQHTRGEVLDAGVLKAQGRESVYSCYLTTSDPILQSSRMQSPRLRATRPRSRT